MTTTDAVIGLSEHDHMLLAHHIGRIADADFIKACDEVGLAPSDAIRAGASPLLTLAMRQSRFVKQGGRA